MRAIPGDTEWFTGLAKYTELVDELTVLSQQGWTVFSVLPMQVDFDSAEWLYTVIAHRKVPQPASGEGCMG